MNGSQDRGLRTDAPADVIHGQYGMGPDDGSLPEFWSSHILSPNNSIDNIVFGSNEVWHKYRESHGNVLLIDLSSGRNDDRKTFWFFVNLVGKDSDNDNVYLGFAFLRYYRREDFAWLLDTVKTQFENFSIPLPQRIFSSEMENCYGTVEKVFPGSHMSLWLKEINGDFLKQCLREVVQDTDREFDFGRTAEDMTPDERTWMAIVAAWIAILESDSREEFNAQWKEFQANYKKKYPHVCSYLKYQWVRPHRRILTSLWTRQELGFDHNAYMSGAKDFLGEAADLMTLEELVEAVIAAYRETGVWRGDVHQQQKEFEGDTRVIRLLQNAEEEEEEEEEKEEEEDLESAELGFTWTGPSGSAQKAVLDATPKARTKSASKAKPAVTPKSDTPKSASKVNPKVTPKYDLNVEALGGIPLTGGRTRSATKAVTPKTPKSDLDMEKTRTRSGSTPRKTPKVRPGHGKPRKSAPEASEDTETMKSASEVSEDTETMKSVSEVSEDTETMKSASEVSEDTPKVTRGRGRPRKSAPEASEDTETTTSVSEVSEDTPKTTRGRGRPRKNSTPTETTSSVSEVSEDTPKTTRGRGRPRKNSTPTETKRSVSEVSHATPARTRSASKSTTRSATRSATQSDTQSTTQSTTRSARNSLLHGLPQFTTPNGSPRSRKRSNEESGSGSKTKRRKSDGLNGSVDHDTPRSNKRQSLGRKLLNFWSNNESP